MINENIFEAERSYTIEKITETNDIINEVITSGGKFNILSMEQSEKLRSIASKNEKIKHKLESNEFEIAIVGLEKAGKSTFANALIKSDILPSAPERCTFTSTRLVNGDNKAVIQFYTETEFNDIFIDLLREIGISSVESNMSFRTIDLNEFENYFDSLEESDPLKYKSHVGKTDEEIKDIIRCRDKLILNGDVKYFIGDELNEDDFKSYIKGEDKGKDTSRPRSVKSIEIESSELKQLDNSIIYDVPGFDSPTKIHIRQTEERLMAADAIILVTNVGVNPSLQGTTLSVITKNTDSDGIELKDKLFVFGNQLDRVNNERDLAGNPDILKKDVVKYKIGSDDRVFFGSALKYLSDEGIIATDDFKYEINSGVDDIRDALITYYETERFEILKRKIDNNYKIMQSIFGDILNESDLDDVFSEKSEEGKLTKIAYNKIESDVIYNLHKLRDKLKDEIIQQSYFTKKFKSSVEHGDFFCDVTESDFERCRIYNSDSIRNDLPIEKINQSIRNSIHKKYLSNFSLLINSMTDEKSKEIDIELLRVFTRSVSGGSEVGGSNVEDLCKKYLLKVNRDISHAESSFTYLIERFSRDIFDSLLSSPILSQDRTNRYLASRMEFSYLDSYYSKGVGGLVNVILTQRNNFLFNMDKFKNVSSITAKLLNIAITSFSNHNVIIDQLKELSELFKNTSVNLFLNDSGDVADIIKNASPSKNGEDVLKEINLDIYNLKGVLEKAVIPASNLELAFLNGIDKQIKRIISAIEDKNTKTSDLWDDFISRIVPIIKDDEFKKISDKVEIFESKRQLLGKLESSLGKHFYN